MDLSQLLRSPLELETMLSSILAHTQHALACEGGSIWLFDDQQNALGRVCAAGAEAEYLPHLPLTDDFLAPLSEPALTQALAHPGVRSRLNAPLAVPGERPGFISLINKKTAPEFSTDDAAALQTVAAYTALAIHNARLAEREARTSERHKLLDQIHTYFQETLEIEVLIPRIFAEVNKAIQAQGQSIWLIDDDGETTTCKYATGTGAGNVINLTVPLDKSIVGNTILTQQPILVEDAQNDPRLYRHADAKTGLTTRTLMSVPMVYRGFSIGALQAINKRHDEFFTQDDLFLFTSIASSAALAIENARLYQQLQASYDLTLYALTAALDLRDRETEGHSQRVVAYTVRLAQQLGLPPDLIEHIRRGALLHDVGKIGVPDRILLKPGALDAEERREIEKHPQKGYEMLLGIRPLEQAIHVVLSHHERWDGSGYPFGLVGEATPIGARIFAVADTYDALTSDRPYRARRPYETARQIIEAEAGRQFDPEVVAAFLAIPQAEWEEIRQRVMTEVERRRQQHADLVHSQRTNLARTELQGPAV